MTKPLEPSNIPTFQPSSLPAFISYNLCKKCPETGETTKSLEYGKCLETGETTKSLEYRKCLETNPLKNMTFVTHTPHHIPINILLIMTLQETDDFTPVYGLNSILPKVSVSTQSSACHISISTTILIFIEGNSINPTPRIALFVGSSGTKFQPYHRYMHHTYMHASGSRSRIIDMCIIHTCIKDRGT